GLDANDIDLEARLLHIEEELTVLIRSQYYFVTGGASLTRIPETHEDGSWRRVAVDKMKSAPFQESFSFHQGRLSPSNIAMLQKASLPEINEFTTVINDPGLSNNSSKGSEHGSGDY
ncbi:hypothetical protein BBJ28_00009046, partial [Nothophytophthora sp. Chile5]